MKLLLATIMTAFFSSCGTLPERQEARPIPPRDKCSLRLLASRHDAAFTPYLGQFALDARLYEVTCLYTEAMVFEDAMDNDWVGYCAPVQKIAVHPAFWQQATEIERMTLIYHELGHCALGLDHRTDKTAIMNPHVLDPMIANRHWERLVREMFVDARSILWR